MTLARLEIISLGELNEMMDYADAAYSYLIEQRDTRDWLQAKRIRQGNGGFFCEQTQDMHQPLFPADMSIKAQTGSS